jgi:hypothetical protein
MSTSIMCMITALWWIKTTRHARKWPLGELKAILSPRKENEQKSKRCKFSGGSFTLYRRAMTTFKIIYTIVTLVHFKPVTPNVPDTASYIRGWIQMVLAPNDLFSWNNKYSKYIEYNNTDAFTCFFLAMHTTYSVHAGILKPWRGRLPWSLVVFSSYHVFTLPLSGLNWCSLFPPWGFGPPFPKTAPPFTGSAHTPLPGSGTLPLRGSGGSMQGLFLVSPSSLASLRHLLSLLLPLEQIQ